MPSNPLQSFRYDKPMMSAFIERLRQYAFRRLTRSGLGLFLKSNDIISASPQTTGEYDPDINRLMDLFVQLGHGDFLIDVGANVGLTSCQNGNKFRWVHMYEPNPICAQVLRANCMLMLASVPHEIHAFALSDIDGSEVLRIPKHNWGGAFIHRENSYPDQVLSTKDGFSTISDGNYILVDVSIKSTSVELARVFFELVANNLTRGVIKIDVEGYEEKILSHIVDIIPSSMECFVVLESWNTSSKFGEIAARSARTIDVYKYATSPTLLNWSSPKSSFVTTKRLQAMTGENWRGDIVVHIKPETVST